MFFAHEFKGNRVLQACLAVVAFIYFVVFYGWMGRNTITTTLIDTFGYRCPMYFQNCESLYFLNALPHGYSQTLLYMMFFGLLAFAVYLLTEQKWRTAAIVLCVPYLWHAAHIFFLTDFTKGNYEYYVFFFSTIILFFPHKEFFAKLLVVLFYFMSTFAKIHPAWITGGYFTNLQLGLPIFPYWSIPIMTHFVIFMEMIAAWFLLSKHPVLQRTVLFFFVCFHLYSGILVGYRYPATVLPMLVVLFGPWYRWTPPPLDRKSLIGWGLVVLLICLQVSPKLVAGDEKLTLEANSYGLYMFDSNHQCISEATFHFENGGTDDETRTVTSARNRCEPYRYWFRFNELCEHQPGIERVSWDFYHSINGDDFLHIVELEDACSVEYTPFGRNEWIKTHADNPASIGKPAKNLYY